METIQISLPDGTTSFLQTQATKHGFPSPTDYVQSLLADMQRREQDRRELEQKLLEGVRSPKVAGDEAFWRERRKKSTTNTRSWIHASKLLPNRIHGDAIFVERVLHGSRNLDDLL